MKFNLSYQLKNDQEKIASQSKEAVAEITDESLSISPKFGEVILFSLHDIIEAKEKDYKIFLKLSSRESLILSDLGYQFEDFFKIMVKKSNVMAMKDRLLTEEPKKSYPGIEFIFQNDQEKIKGLGELKFYSDRFVVVPLESEPISFFFNSITQISNKNYQLEIQSSENISIIFLKLGELFEPLSKLFSDLINQQSLDIQSILQTLFPTINPSLIRNASRLLKQGQAAQKKELDKISSDLWLILEKKLEAMNLKPEYDYLISLGNKEESAIGFKKEGDKEFIWFLIPVKNTLALETATEDDGGKATYFFKLEQEVSQQINNINEAMILTSFKREPIYLSEEKLHETQYQRYLVSIEKMPSLRLLRRLFIGRIIHQSPEQWQKDVNELLNKK